MLDKSYIFVYIKITLCNNYVRGNEIMKVLQIATSGMKNIFKDIIVTFANSTIEKGIKKVNNVKGIFGFNGAGKTAFISSVDLYRNVVLNPTYLMQNDITKKLDKLINYHLKKFRFSIVFEFQGNIVIKHHVEIEKSQSSNTYIISFEEISLSSGRTLDDKYKSLLKKKNGVVIFANDDRFFRGSLNYLKDAELDYSSMVSKVVSRLVSNNPKEAELSIAEKTILKLYFDISDIDVYLSKDDSHNNYIYDKEALNDLINNVEDLKNEKDNWTNLYADEVFISKQLIHAYESDNKKLERFIKIFKPEIKEIYLEKAEDGNIYHVRRVFRYENFNVEYEFESSGIKQLVKLFTYLIKCSRGAAVFIDEIDTNINTVYFSKLISFFKNFGKGQLIFTTHNIEAMNALKGQSKSILALGINNNMDVWVGKGNKSPTRDYIDGFFPNSPMNIEDFDFVNIFLGED